jgi:hypothetical protein
MTRSLGPDDVTNPSGLPDGWEEWGGEIMFVAGHTSGGAPYGVCLEEFPPEDLPDELREVAAERRAQEVRGLTRLRSSSEWPPDVHDVPF